MDLHEAFQVAKTNKVTIIIEGDGQTTTIKVPQAEMLDVISSAIPDGEPGKMEFFTDRAKLKLEMTAIFDKAHDHLYSIETSTVGVEV
jgi:hypothetical protein